MKPSARWRIGDLARAANVSMRPARSEGDQRVDDASEVKRVARIRALRELGLSLEAIAHST